MSLFRLISKSSFIDTPQSTEQEEPPLAMAAQTMTSTKLIIFDCDGVLIDSDIVVCRRVGEDLTRLGDPLSMELCLLPYRRSIEHTLRGFTLASSGFTDNAHYPWV